MLALPRSRGSFLVGSWLRIGGGRKLVRNVLLRRASALQLGRSRYYSSGSGMGSPHDTEFSKNTDYMHIQNILLQKNQERMNKQRLLADANSFYERFKIKTKWFLIRGNRPFSADEISTMFSWLVISQLAWVILGTTTFVSIILLICNTVMAKEWVGRLVGKTLNMFITGVDIRFEDALVPEWRKGCIRFDNVRLTTSSSTTSNDQHKHDSLLEFNLQFYQIELTLSLKKWLLGNGLIHNLSVFGMRGEVTMNQSTTKDDINLIEWFSTPQYHLGKVKMTDSSILLHDNKVDTDYKLSVYNMELPKLRLEWAITDFLNADVVDGSINGSLFSIHQRQHKLTFPNDLKNDLPQWKRISRLRLDAIDVTKLGLQGSQAFNWINSGTVEIVADVMLPNEDIDGSGQKWGAIWKSSNMITRSKYLVLDLKFKFKDLSAIQPVEPPKLSDGRTIASLNELKSIVQYINKQRELYHTYNKIQNTNSVWNAPNIFIKKTKSYPTTTTLFSSDEDNVMGQHIIRFHEHPTYNEHNEIILSCRVAKTTSELRDLILFRETGVYDSLTMELYADLMKLVEESGYKQRNDWMKIWGTTFASQLILLGFGAMV